ncbi:hypothetical protein [Peribacillus simplex]|nr:hypothetical protein [Peribacillus simplex]
MPKVVIEYIAKQLDVSPDRFDEYSWVEKKKPIRGITKIYEIFLVFEN